MYLEWKNKNCQNNYTIIRGDLQIQVNPYQITNGTFADLEEKTLKFVWRHKRPQIVKAILRTK